MNEKESPYQELLDFADNMEIGYVHRYRYFKEEHWSEFQVKTVAGCQGVDDFRRRVTEIIIDCQTKAREAISEMNQTDRLSSLREWKEEVHELMGLAERGVVEFEESEYGPASSRYYTFLPVTNRNGNLEVDGYAPILKLLEEKTEPYALEWVSLVNDAEAGLSFLQNQELSNGLTQSRRPFIREEVIKRLDSVTSQDFDLSRLVAICKEINKAYAAECPMSVAILSRALLDHIPPIFGRSRFSEVANQHGGKSLNLDLTEIKRFVTGFRWC